MGCDIHMFSETKVGDRWRANETFINDDECIYVPYYERIYSGRDYKFFGALAGVRQPEALMFNVKGFPDDASEDVADCYKSWGRNAHTPNFLTLAELQDYDADRTIKIVGQKDKDQIEALYNSLATSDPDYSLLYPYCAWSTADHVVDFEADIPLSYLVEPTLRHLIEKLEQKGEPDKVRIVFWFNN